MMRWQGAGQFPEDYMVPMMSVDRRVLLSATDRYWPFCDMGKVADNGSFRLGSSHACLI